MPTEQTFYHSGTDLAYMGETFEESLMVKYLQYINDDQVQVPYSLGEFIDYSSRLGLSQMQMK